MRAATSLVHVCLVPHPEAIPLVSARLTGRARLALLLQAAGLLSLLDRARWRLPSWAEAGLTPAGRLAARALPGQALRPAQADLRDLLAILFSHDFAKGPLAGRGSAWRVARGLAAAWEQDLLPLAPDQTVVQILEAAPFLWEPAFGPSRLALAGRLAWEERGTALWVAGPGRFSALVLAGCAGLEELEQRLAGAAAGELWQRSGSARGPAVRRWRRRELIDLLGAGRAQDSTLLEGEPRSSEGVAVSSSVRHPRDAVPGVPGWSVAPEGLARLEKACLLLAAGRFERALAVLARSREAAPRAVRARCQLQLGRLGAARATLGSLRAAELPAGIAVELGEVAARAFANAGEPEGALPWIERALAEARRAGDGELLEQAHAVAAMAAWDRQDPPAMDQHLDAAGALAGSPGSWRRHQAEALRAMALGRGGEVVEHIRLALLSSRPILYRHEAGGLWNDLGVGRVMVGDLGGAERAFRHAYRLLGGCDGPRKATLALLNLAEVRLRQGRLAGVREILERSLAENRLAGNLRGLVQDSELLARYELVLGEPEAALAFCRGARAEVDRRGYPWREAELAVLAARALGRLGRSLDAAAELGRTSPRSRAELDPEELPALWALAGESAAARAEARNLERPLAELWEAVLDGRVAPATTWAVLESLPPHRAASVVADAVAVSARTVPPAWRTRASETFRRLGGARMADRLEADAGDPWRALEVYAGAPLGDLESLAAVFAAAGCRGVRLAWLPASVESVGSGAPDPEMRSGRAQSATPVAGIVLECSTPEGRLVLAGEGAGWTPAVKALLRLAARDFAARGAAPEHDRSHPPGRPRAGGETGIGGRPIARSPAEPRLRGARAPGAPAVMLGDSAAMVAVQERVARLAGADIPVLILGESGTGKELAARRIHRGSARAAAPFIAVNCAALSETLLLADLFGHVRGAFTGAERDRAGIFEAAHGGTVLLDEVGDLPASAQGMLLRVLQEGEVRRLGESLPRRVDVRLLFATHRDLDLAVREGSFRLDLFYRIRVGVVALPPLRERAADVLMLADHFLGMLGGARGIRLSAPARQLLLRHRWPGNIRELHNVLAHAAALSDGVIEPSHLEIPATWPAAAAPYHQEVDALRRRLVSSALAECGGNRAEAAHRLGLSRQALSYLVRRLGI